MKQAIYYSCNFVLNINIVSGIGKVLKTVLKTGISLNKTWSQLNKSNEAIIIWNRLFLSMWKNCNKRDCIVSTFIVCSLLFTKIYLPRRVVHKLQLHFYFSWCFAVSIRGTIPPLPLQNNWPTKNARKS